MKYDDTDASEETFDLGADDDIQPLGDRLAALRSARGAGGYSAQARQRIEYLQELRRLRAQIGDDGFEGL
ncbi:hypothetical protein F2Q65_02965 [Thiohalocapsa marina]|uniref:Uncharacterized protein n=1 Tax=Thiohalocapsa marina TaxID=424902 RepID=A0A5M8FSL3_9GAMM|nr:hypothetical protein [Thiohalocapsa marina]KAA6186875.1 hypothetical protein F2Q65_02965 [Thiohalocapsa marina]